MSRKAPQILLCFLICLNIMTFCDFIRVDVWNLKLNFNNRGRPISLDVVEPCLMFEFLNFEMVKESQRINTKIQVLQKFIHFKDILHFGIPCIFNVPCQGIKLHRLT